MFRLLDILHFAENDEEEGGLDEDTSEEKRAIADALRTCLELRKHFCWKIAQVLLLFRRMHFLFAAEQMMLPCLLCQCLVVLLTTRLTTLTARCVVRGDQQDTTHFDVFDTPKYQPPDCDHKKVAKPDKKTVKLRFWLRDLASLTH